MGDDSPALQLDLPGGDAWQIQALTAADDSPQFSGCTGEARHRIRRLRDQILELTAAGVGAKRIAAALDVSPQAVRAVRSVAWERGELDPLKQRLGRQYLATADLLRAEALERIDEIPAQVLLLASAQAADKGQLLTGGATTRIERACDAPADLHEMIDALPVECVPVDAPESGYNKSPAEGASLGQEASQVEPSGAVADSLSAASPSVAEACATDCASHEEKAGR